MDRKLMLVLLMCLSFEITLRAEAQSDTDKLVLGLNGTETSTVMTEILGLPKEVKATAKVTTNVTTTVTVMTSAATTKNVVTQLVPASTSKQILPGSNVPIPSNLGTTSKLITKTRNLPAEKTTTLTTTTPTTTQDPNAFDFIACSWEKEDQMIQLTCRDSEVVTGHIFAGWSRLGKHGPCRYINDTFTLCTFDPGIQELVEQIYSCVWNKSQCSFNVKKYVRGNHPDCEESMNEFNFMAVRGFKCVERSLVHHQCMKSEPVVIRNTTKGYIMIPYVLTKTAKLHPKNCNTTWIPPDGVNSIRIKSEIMDLPFPVQNVPEKSNLCNRGKLMITAEFQNGSSVSCIFCGTDPKFSFELTFVNPMKATFDATNLPHIDNTDEAEGRLGTGYRLWFKGSKEKLADEAPLPPQCSFVPVTTVDFPTTEQTTKTHRPGTPPAKKPFARHSFLQKAHIIWIVIAVILFLGVVIVIVIVCIFKSQKTRTRNRNRNGSAPSWNGSMPSDAVRYHSVTRNNNNVNEPDDPEELNMNNLTRNGHSFREHVHSLRRKQENTSV